MSKTAALYKFRPASELGSADDYPPGSIEWAERISNRLQGRAESITEYTVHHLKRTIEAIWAANPHPWEIWPDGKPFRTPDDYCQSVTGHSWEFLVRVVAEFGNDPDFTGLFGPVQMQADLARAQAEHRGQGARTDLLGYHINKLKRGGTGSAYLLRRLARISPDHLKAFEAGQFKSARAAAIAAGIIKPPTPLDHLRTAWRKATPAEREAFRSEIQGQDNPRTDLNHFLSFT